MKITIVGTGYVGLVSGACLAEVGHEILCLDTDAHKIAQLKIGNIPIYEPHLDSLIKRNVTIGRLHFTTDIQESVNWSQIQFIAVGTPMDEDGSSDIQYVLQAVKNIAKYLLSDKIIVIKSTVPVGTNLKIQRMMLKSIAVGDKKFKISIVSNPEFLKEGDAIRDFMNPNRIIIGTKEKETEKVLRKIYAPFNRNHSRIIVMDPQSAELTKYASNCMLATRISFMNEIANLAEKVHADIESVRLGMGADPRIGYDFLYAGCGYGGSCLPKDIRALIHKGEKLNVQMPILKSVVKINALQKASVLEKIKNRFVNEIQGRHFALWGLAFKPNTNDMREASSRVLIDSLTQLGATLCAYDPVARAECQRIYSNNTKISYANTALAALENADALIIVTEWKEFCGIDLYKIKSLLKNPIIFDGRNIYSIEQMEKSAFEYYGIGRQIKHENKRKFASNPNNKLNRIDKKNITTSIYT